MRYSIAHLIYLIISMKRQEPTRQTKLRVVDNSYIFRFLYKSKYLVISLCQSDLMVVYIQCLHTNIL